MLAIITDPEDVYGNIHMVGNAELAARLGSINTFERRGTITWMDDFEGATPGWGTTTEDPTGEIALTTKYHRSGSQCLRIYPGSVVDKEAAPGCLLPVRNAGKMGYEIAFSGGALCKTCDFRMWMYNGTNVLKAEIRYDIANDKLQYLNSGGTYTDIASDLKLLSHNRGFHIIKFVVDWTNNEYIRLYLDQTEYSLADVAVNSSESEADSHLFVDIKVISGHALNNAIHVDNFILTENEPD